MKRKKIVAMIPARLGSQRVPRKNIRFLHDKPLVEWIIQAAKGSDLIDEVWVNSENFVLQEIALRNDVKFYQRPLGLASSTATNDEFVCDFLKSVHTDVLIQLLPTSPFITSSVIDKFVTDFLDLSEHKNTDTLISVKEEKIECIEQNGDPINFEFEKRTENSQNISSVFPYACGMMCWDSRTFLENMEQNGSAYHGSKRSFSVVDHLSAIDIDTEADFRFAELIAQSRPLDQVLYEPLFYGDKVEVCVPDILKRENIAEFQESEPGRFLDTSLAGATRVVNTKDNSATVITQKKGEGNRRHYHPNWHEWWYILKGEWLFEVNGETSIVKEGSFITIRPGLVHKITAIGDGPNVRLAVSRDDIPHVYV